MNSEIVGMLAALRVKASCNYLTPWSLVILEKLPVVQLLTNFPKYFMQTEGSLPLSIRLLLGLLSGNLPHQNSTPCVLHAPLSHPS
jgi:hypothetical protein